MKILLLIMLVALAGCKKSEPPAPAPEPVQQTSPTGLPPGHPPIQEPNPEWTVPEGWRETPAGMMRRANFTITGEGDATAEVVVSAFPGDVGGMLNNINRWRGQIGLGPVTAEQADTMTSTMELGRKSVKVVDVTGQQRMIVVIAPHGPDSWFFKITGEPSLVEAQKQNLFALVRSVQW